MVDEPVAVEAKLPQPRQAPQGPGDLLEPMILYPQTPRRDGHSNDERFPGSEPPWSPRERDALDGSGAAAPTTRDDAPRERTRGKSAPRASYLSLVSFDSPSASEVTSPPPTSRYSSAAQRESSGGRRRRRLSPASKCVSDTMLPTHGPRSWRGAIDEMVPWPARCDPSVTRATRDGGERKRLTLRRPELEDVAMTPSLSWRESESFGYDRLGTVEFDYAVRHRRVRDPSPGFRRGMRGLHGRTIFGTRASASGSIPRFLPRG